jgi:hypothetical protein
MKIIILFLLLSLKAHAYCEQEKKELAEKIAQCDQWIAITGIAGTAGSVISSLFPVKIGVTLAAGGLAGIGPALTAKNLCRIKDEKWNNLNRCLKGTIDQLKPFDDLLISFHQQMKDISSSYAGYDLSNPEVFNTYLDDIEKIYNSTPEESKIHLRKSNLFITIEQAIQERKLK